MWKWNLSVALSWVKSLNEARVFERSDLLPEHRKVLRRFWEGSSVNPYRDFFENFRNAHLSSWSEFSWAEWGVSHSQRILDVGCYLGRFTLEVARLNPSWGVLGLDRNYKRVVTTYSLALNQKLKNVSVLLGQVQDLLPVVPDHFFQGVCLFFPDPWIKQRQRRHRLSHQEVFWQHLKRVIAPQGFFWFKTDQKSYFQEVSQLLSHWSLEEAPCPRELRESSYQTQFECLFQNQKTSTFQMLLRSF